MIKWMQRKFKEYNTKQDEKRQERVRRKQFQDNTIAILERNELPDINWASKMGNMPFRFMKSEHLVYLFNPVEYREQRIRREIHGRSSGMSVRVVKGVSFRIGASKGTPVEREYIQSHGTGILAITTKHIYFHGAKSFRIPFSKIVSVESCRNGVAVTRDRARPQPEFFIVESIDASFMYELVQAIPSMEIRYGKISSRIVEDFHMHDYDAWDDDFVDSE